MRFLQTRREYLGGLGAAAALSAAGGVVFESRAGEAPPEIKTIRLAKNPTICVAPQYIVTDLLLREGFDKVEYVLSDAGVAQSQALSKDDIDFSLHFSGPVLLQIDAGERIVILAGMHVGCFELFARNGIHSVADLKGRTVGIKALNTSQHAFLSCMATLVGLDPRKDINWLTSETVKPVELYADGKIDAFLGFPPEPQLLRSRGIGDVIVNSAKDRPWSQYFCCMLAGSRDFARKYPVATKRALRALLAATDLCVSAPVQAARQMVDGGFTPRYDLALQTLSDVPYGEWRDYDPEDTLRFYALRLREARMIKSGPNEIIVNGADWRFLNEIRREMGI